MRRKQIWWIVPAVIILGAAVWSQIVSSVEHPKYMVVQSQGNIQIRDYGPMIVAETDAVPGDSAPENSGDNTGVGASDIGTTDDGGMSRIFDLILLPFDLVINR